MTIDARGKLSSCGLIDAATRKAVIAAARKLKNREETIEVIVSDRRFGGFLICRYWGDDRFMVSLGGGSGWTSAHSAEQVPATIDIRMVGLEWN